MHLQFKPSSRTLRSLAFASSLMAALTCAVAAPTVELFVAAPSVQASTSSSPTLITETFDGKVPGLLPATGTWAVGPFTSTAPNGAYNTANGDGGAGGTGNFLFVGGDPPDGITLTLNGASRYVGFWWSAGDPTNQIDFYDGQDNLLVSFTTSSLVDFLGASASITSGSGVSYPTSGYYGNPNPGGGQAGQPYAYVHLLISGTSATFKKIVIRGRYFELDNLSIANSSPVDPAWVRYGSQAVAVPPGQDDPASIPTLSQWGLIALSLLVAAGAFVGLGRHKG